MFTSHAVHGFPLQQPQQEWPWWPPQPTHCIPPSMPLPSVLCPSPCPSPAPQPCSLRAVLVLHTHSPNHSPALLYAPSPLPESCPLHTLLPPWPGPPPHLALHDLPSSTPLPLNYSPVLLRAPFPIYSPAPSMPCPSAMPLHHHSLPSLSPLPTSPTSLSHLPLSGT